MNLRLLRLVLLAAAMNVGVLRAADSTAAVAQANDTVAQPDEPPPKPIDEVLELHGSGVEASVIIAYLRSVSDVPNVSASDLIRLREEGVAPDVMNALILKGAPSPSPLPARDIIQLHEKGVPSEVITALLHKGRRNAAKPRTMETTASAPAAKPNQKFYLAGPRRGSTIIIPYRPYYHSRYPRYYGPSFDCGFGYGAPSCW